MHDKDKQNVIQSNWAQSVQFSDTTYFPKNLFGLYKRITSLLKNKCKSMQAVVLRKSASEMILFKTFQTKFKFSMAAPFQLICKSGECKNIVWLPHVLLTNTSILL